MSAASFSTLAGSYGISAPARQDSPLPQRSARDILVLKRDGSYAVYFAAKRSLQEGAVPDANLTGVYALTGDGALVLTSHESGDVVTGVIEEDGSLLLSHAGGEPSWRAKKIDCIWPNCRNCRGYQWHYCVRAAR